MRPDAPSPPSAPPVPRLAFQLAVATLGRLFLNTARRFPYPFAPALGRGLGVPLTAITSLIAVSEGSGLLSPLFGPLGDRWGYRTLMLGGLGLLTCGMLGAGLWPVYGIVFVGVFLAGLGKSVFDPAVQAYIGQTVPYRRRALAIGLAEMAWAGSSLLGIPIMGLLIERLHWRAPFVLLGGLGLFAALGLAVAVAPDKRSQASGSPVSSHREAWGRMLGQRSALAGLVFGFLISMANTNLFVVYGAWLAGSFSLGVATLGAATMAIGIAEIGGESLTALAADRIGLKPALAGGAALSAVAYALLPAADRSLPLALAGLFLVFLAYEFTIVTSFSLLTEVLPGARGTMMSAYVAAMGLGRMAGAMAGGPAWLIGGLWSIGLFSAGLNALALAVLVWGLKHWVREDAPESPEAA